MVCFALFERGRIVAGAATGTILRIVTRRPSACMVAIGDMTILGPRLLLTLWSGTLGSALFVGALGVALSALTIGGPNGKRSREAVDALMDIGDLVVGEVVAINVLPRVALLTQGGMAVIVLKIAYALYRVVLLFPNSRVRHGRLCKVLRTVKRRVGSERLARSGVSVMEILSHNLPRAGVGAVTLWGWLVLDAYRMIA